MGSPSSRLEEAEQRIAELEALLAEREQTRARPELGLYHAQKLEAVGELAAGIAHEINTPVQFVGDSVRFLRDAFEDVERLLVALMVVRDATLARDATDEMARATLEMETEVDLAYHREQIPKAFARTIDGLGRVASIVRAVKDFSHPDGREQAPADLQRALDSTLVVAANEYKLIADIEKDYGDLPPVVCHVGDLNQVFLNLIINAAHAIAERRAQGVNTARGKIRVLTRSDETSAIIEISDNGCGIAPRVRGRVFDPFFTTKPVGRGTGQGLAIAHSIVVDKHRGSLSFRSEEGAGTTFVVRLPLHGARGVAT